MTEHPQDFEQLRRVLALKRYEQPPPGYFNSFSREVIVRIRAGELGEPEAKWWAFDGSWLKWVWDACERRPVFAGGLGVAFCGFVAAATLISMNDVTEPLVAQTVPGNQYVSAQNGLSAAVPATVIGAATDVSYTDFPGFVHGMPNDPNVSSLFSLSAGNSLQPAAVSLIEVH